MPVIVFLDTSTVGNIPDLDRLRDFGDLILHETTAPGEVAGRVSRADIIITNKVVINREVIDSAENLRLICIAATGMNNVDLGYAAHKSITVKNVAGYSTNSVAQSTFAMLLYLLGKLRYYDDYVRSGEYSRSPIFTHIGPSFHELHGSVLGIIGLGTIGKKVASIGRAFGSEIIYYSTSGKNNDPDYKRVGLDDLLTQSDFISIHAPLNENTHDLINMEKLRKMKRRSILINAGRGGIVNEKDLADALNGGIIAAAGLDVLEKEPIARESPFLAVKEKDRILIMPHVAWASVESRTLLVNKIYENIGSFLSAG